MKRSESGIGILIGTCTLKVSVKVVLQVDIAYDYDKSEYSSGIYTPRIMKPLNG
jgi:hypothetical protein